MTKHSTTRTRREKQRNNRAKGDPTPGDGNKKLQAEQAPAKPEASLQNAGTSEPSAASAPEVAQPADQNNPMLRLSPFATAFVPGKMGMKARRGSDSGVSDTLQSHPLHTRNVESEEANTAPCSASKISARVWPMSCPLLGQHSLQDPEPFELTPAESADPGDSLRSSGDSSRDTTPRSRNNKKKEKGRLRSTTLQHTTVDGYAPSTTVAMCMVAGVKIQSPQPFHDEGTSTFWCKPRGVSLLHHWKVYYDCTAERGISVTEFVESMSVLGSFDDMMEFMEAFGHNLHNIANTATLRVFKSSVQPAWEHPANSGPGAGKWSILLPSKRCSVATLLALLQAMVTGGLHCANGVVLQKKNRQHMVVVWTRAEEISMGDQRVAIQALLPEPSLSKLSFKTHMRSKNRNTKEEVFSMLQDGRHARTASLEVHAERDRGSFDLKCMLNSPLQLTDSDYSSTASPSSHNADTEGAAATAIPGSVATIAEEGESVGCSPASSHGTVVSLQGDLDLAEWDVGEGEASYEAEAAEAVHLPDDEHDENGSSSEGEEDGIPRVSTFVDLAEEAGKGEEEGDRGKTSLTRVGSFVDLQEVEEEIELHS